MGFQRGKFLRMKTARPGTRRVMACARSASGRNWVRGLVKTAPMFLKLAAHALPNSSHIAQHRSRSPSTVDHRLFVMTRRYFTRSHHRPEMWVCCKRSGSNGAGGCLIKCLYGLSRSCPLEQANQGSIREKRRAGSRRRINRMDIGRQVQ